MKKNSFIKAVAVTASVAMVSMFAFTGCGSSAAPESSAGSAEPVDAADYSDYEEAMNSAFGQVIDKYNSMATGETAESDLENGTHSNSIKAQDNLFVAHTELPEGSINTYTTIFFYEHDDAYQAVQYFTNAATGVDTIIILDVSADGSEITPVYVSTTDDKTSGSTIELSDLVKGLKGSIEIASKQNGDGSVAKTQTIKNEAGEVVETCDTSIVTNEDGNQSVHVVVSQNGEQVSTIDFNVASNETGTTQSITIADADGSATLSFDKTDDKIDITTAALN